MGWLEDRRAKLTEKIEKEFEAAIARVGYGYREAFAKDFLEYPDLGANNMADFYVGYLGMSEGDRHAVYKYARSASKTPMQAAHDLVEIAEGKGLVGLLAKRGIKKINEQAEHARESLLSEIPSDFREVARMDIERNPEIPFPDMIAFFLKYGRLDTNNRNLIYEFAKKEGMTPVWVFEEALRRRQKKEEEDQGKKP